MCEAKNEVQENFAYCVVQLNEVTAADSKIKGDIVGFNCKLGTYEAEMHFEIIGVQDQIVPVIVTQPQTHDLTEAC